MNELNNIEEILDELGEAYHNNYPDQKARKKAIQSITEQVRLGRTDELERLVRNTGDIELMNPHKPFVWGVDTWTQNVPVIPRMRVDDRIEELKSTTLLEGDK